MSVPWHIKHLYLHSSYGYACKNLNYENSKYFSSKKLLLFILKNEQTFVKSLEIESNKYNRYFWIKWIAKRPFRTCIVSDAWGNEIGVFFAELSIYSWKRRRECNISNRIYGGIYIVYARAVFYAFVNRNIAFTSHSGLLHFIPLYSHSVSQFVYVYGFSLMKHNIGNVCVRTLSMK